MRILPASIALAAGALAGSGVDAQCPVQSGPAENGLTQSGDVAIRQVAIKGSSLGEDALFRTYVSDLGQADTTSASRKIAQAISDLYRHSDVALYDVSVAPSEQCGIVRISVVEGAVSETRIRGTVSVANARLISAYLARIAADHPLHVSTLQRYVSLIRDIQGIRADIAFEQTDRPDRVRLVATVSQLPTKISMALDNRGADTTGRVQVQAATALNGVFLGGDTLQAGFAISDHPDRLFSAVASYSANIGHHGDRISLSGSRSRSYLQELRYRSDTWNLSFQITHPLLRSYTASADVGYSVKRIDSRLTYYGYNLLRDRGWLTGPFATFEAKRSAMQIAMTASAIVGRTSRSSDFVGLPATHRVARFRMDVAGNWSVSRLLTLRLRGRAQLGSHRLPASEQIYLGGEYGRANPSGFLLGDSGYSGSVEVARRVGRATTGETPPTEIYAFLDRGKVTFRDPLFGIRDNQRLGSQGAGIRFRIREGMTASVEGAAGTARAGDDTHGYRRANVGVQIAF